MQTLSCMIEFQLILKNVYSFAFLCSSTHLLYMNLCIFPLEPVILSVQLSHWLISKIKSFTCVHFFFYLYESHAFIFFFWKVPLPVLLLLILNAQRYMATSSHADFARPCFKGTVLLNLNYNFLLMKKYVVKCPAGMILHLLQSSVTRGWCLHYLLSCLITQPRMLGCGGRSSQECVFVFVCMCVCAWAFSGWVLWVVFLHSR